MSADGSAHGGFEYPESAAHALGLAAQRAEWLRRPAGTTPEVDVDLAAARAIVDAAAKVARSRRRPRSCSRRTASRSSASGRAETPDEAAAAADELGLPAVVKTAAAGAHKTESGGVALDLRTADEVREAAARDGRPGDRPAVPHRGRRSCSPGSSRIPVFGPLVAFGPGGVLAELIGSANFALAPLTDVDAGELLGTGKAAKLVDGWRGAPAADRGALEDLLHRLSRLAVDLPEVAELDLNPVLAGPTGASRSTCGCGSRRAAPAASPKTW